MKHIPFLKKFKTLITRDIEVVDGELVKELPVNQQMLDADTNGPIRLGILVLLIGLGGLLLWSALAPLDEGVPSNGTVSIDTKRKVVQHLSGGIVKEVYIKEGQLVKENEVLLTLDNAMAKAKFQEIKQQYVGDRAIEGRLQAEQKGQNAIVFHDDLLKMKNDVLVQQHMHNQETLLVARRASLSAELQGFQEAIRGQEAQIQGLVGILESRQSQLALLNEQLSNIRDLVKEGYAPQTQQRDLELRIAQVTGEIIDSKAGMMRAKNSIAELRQRSLMRQQDYRKEVDTQMAQVRMEVEANADKFKAFGEEFNRTEVRSPVAGQVVGLQVQTIGSVIQPGQKILDIVPLDEGLILEVKVEPHLIDRIHLGQKADVRFSSFANSPHLALEGKVESVSKDLLTEPGMSPSQRGGSYYLARVALTPDGIKKLGNRLMQPGMPVQVIIKTGDRSLLTYLLHPLIKRMAASFKEE